MGKVKHILQYCHIDNHAFAEHCGLLAMAHMPSSPAPLQPPTWDGQHGRLSACPPPRIGWSSLLRPGQPGEAGSQRLHQLLLAPSMPPLLTLLEPERERETDGLLVHSLGGSERSRGCMQRIGSSSWSLHLRVLSADLTEHSASVGIYVVDEHTDHVPPRGVCFNYPLLLNNAPT